MTNKHRGTLQIAPEVLSRLLQVPDDWELRDIHYNRRTEQIDVLFSGPGLPPAARGATPVNIHQAIYCGEQRLT